MLGSAVNTEGSNCAPADGGLEEFLRTNNGFAPLRKIGATVWRVGIRSQKSGGRCGLAPPRQSRRTCRIGPSLLPNPRGFVTFDATGEDPSYPRRVEGRPLEGARGDPASARPFERSVRIPFDNFS